MGVTQIVERGTNARGQTPGVPYTLASRRRSTTPLNLSTIVLCWSLSSKHEGEHTRIHYSQHTPHAADCRRLLTPTNLPTIVLAAIFETRRGTYAYLQHRHTADCGRSMPPPNLPTIALAAIFKNPKGNIRVFTSSTYSPCDAVRVGVGAAAAGGFGVGLAAGPGVGVAAGAGVGADGVCLTKHSLPPDSPSVADPRGALACLPPSAKRG